MIKRIYTRTSFLWIAMLWTTSLFHLDAQNTGLDLLGGKNRIEIPFTESNGLLMINLRMNNVPLTFLFDTGAENTILFKKR
jgi:predicted aspartyl protease